MRIYPFEGRAPRVDPSAFVVGDATIIGDVVMGAECSVWYGVVIRGDVNFIRIGRRTNLQDNTVVHVTHDTHPTFIEDDVTIGHAAVVHGCHIKRGALIGLGARVMDGVEIGEEALVGAGALVPPGLVVPPRTLVTGVPAKVRRDLTAEEVAGLAASAEHYVQLARRYKAERPPRGGW
jgi:carbonic anhydrase/acetyltransferase-like protein (isoleucine patch superfamily)